MNNINKKLTIISVLFGLLIPTVLFAASVPGMSKHPVADAIRGFAAHDRANQKGRAIAALGPIAKTRVGDYFIEIERMEPIDGGLQVFARVWDTNGEPIGFGKDGTVEIERFRFFNPPILVEDPNGDIVQTWADDVTGEVKEQRFKEDKRAALLQSLSHTIAVKKEKFSPEHIIQGKVGNTTDTYYPNADTESTSVDGGVSNENSSWNAGHDATTGSGVGANDTDANDDVRTQRYETGGFFTIRRLFFLFDTSSIPDTDTVSSATYSVYVTGVNNDDNDGDDWLTIVQSSPAANTAIVSEDYDQDGAITNPTEGTSARKDLTTITSSAYLDFSLNSTGLGWISKTGVTKLGVREGHDVINSQFITGADRINRVMVRMADQAGTASDPKLVVEHTFAAVGPSVSSALQVESATNPERVATSNPRFSAVHENASTTALATSYQIQIDTTGTFTTPYWDSGKKTLSSSTPTNVRSPNIYSTTTFPLDGTKYYWRIKLWDQMNIAGDWTSNTTFFTMSNPTTTLQDLRYTYDLVGNIINIVDLSGTNATASTSYQYDSLYRLTRASTTQAAVTNLLQTYTYDILGNLTNKSDVGNYTYAGTGFANPHAATTINGNSLTYDNAGNLRTWSGMSNVWNYRNRLIDTNKSGTTTHYAYDQNDQRTQMDSKIGAGATSTTKYFSRYYETNGATTTLYLFAGDTLVATMEGNGTATTTSVIHTDHLNGTNVTSNKSGSLAQLNTYYPFGSIRQNEKTGTTDTKRKYIGQEYDETTQLSYLQARYYSGGNGKFLSQDPLVNALGTGDVIYGRSQISVLANPQELNTYGYAQDNPITKSDPTGLWGWQTIPGIANGIGSGVVQFVSSPIQSTYNFGYNAAAAGAEIYRTNGGAIASGWNELNNNSSDYQQGQIIAPIVMSALPLRGALGKSVSLDARASQLQGLLDPFAQTRRTTAVLQTSDGTVVSSGGAALSRAQKAALNPGEVAAPYGGQHAEVGALNYAQSTNALPQSMGVSRPICPSCTSAIQASGGTKTSPTTAVWGKP